MLAEQIIDLTVPETEETITAELLKISESVDHTLHLCSGLLIHEIRNIWKTLYTGESDIFSIVGSLKTLRSVVDENVLNGRPVTSNDLFETFSYSKNTLIIPVDFQFQDVEQFLCIRTLVDNSLAHGGCEVKYNPLENAFEIIDLAGVDWKAGYWEEIRQAYETGRNWENGKRFTNANRGKSIVATIMGIRGYDIPTEVRDGSRKGIKLIFS